MPLAQLKKHTHTQTGESQQVLVLDSSLGDTRRSFIDWMEKAVSKVVHGEKETDSLKPLAKSDILFFFIRSMYNEPDSGQLLTSVGLMTAYFPV